MNQFSSHRYFFISLMIVLSLVQIYCGTVSKVKSDSSLPKVDMPKMDRPLSIAEVLYQKEGKILLQDTNYKASKMFDNIDTAFTRAYYAYETKNFADSLQKIPSVISDSIPSNPAFIPAIHFGIRKANFVIIHHTAQDSANQTLSTFSLPYTEVSAHYLIGKDGILYPLVNDYLRAWHAGESKWGNVEDLNSVSIGIELDNNGYDSFPSPQINTLLHLLTILKTKYNIPTANFIGHSDIAPTRKVDPNKNFPWELLAEKGFGLWYDDTTTIKRIPKSFDPIQALRIIGYSVNPIYPTIVAFRRHFLGIDSQAQALSPTEQKILFSLYKKYM